MDAALQACQAQAGADETHWFFRDAARPGGWSRPHTPAGLAVAVLRAHCRRPCRSARSGELGHERVEKGGEAPQGLCSVWLLSASPRSAAGLVGHVVQL